MNIIRKRGFSLLEIAFAIGLLSIIMVTFAGLVPTGIKINRLTREEVEASNLLSQVVDDIKNTPYSYYTKNGTRIKLEKTGLFNLPSPYSKELANHSEYVYHYGFSLEDNAFILSSQQEVWTLYTLTLRVVQKNIQNYRQRTTIAISVQWPIPINKTSTQNEYQQIDTLVTCWSQEPL